jgi:hypothetical protein
MAERDRLLAGFRQEMQREKGNVDGDQVARRLHDHLVAEHGRLGASIAGLRHWAQNVEIELQSGAMWTIECAGADAYRFYPAHVSDDGSVTWLNVWVTDDLKLGEVIERVREEVFKAPSAQAPDHQ